MDVWEERIYNSLRSYEGFLRQTFEVSSQCSAVKIIHNAGDGCLGQSYRGWLLPDLQQKKNML